MKNKIEVLKSCYKSNINSIIFPDEEKYIYWRMKKPKATWNDELVHKDWYKSERYTVLPKYIGVVNSVNATTENLFSRNYSEKSIINEIEYFQANYNETQILHFLQHLVDYVYTLIIYKNILK